MMRDYPCDYGVCPYDDGYGDSCRYHCGVGDVMMQTTME